MARPTKYTPELTKRICQYISDGLTIRDACYGVKISEDTFCRWRREKPEFAKLVQEATEAQCWSSASLARTSEYRRYQRRQKCHKTQSKGQKWSNAYLETKKTLEQALNGSQSYSSNGDETMFNNSSFGAQTQLEERNETPTNDFGELVCCAPYYNPTTDKVEWVERETFGRATFHRCSVEKWQELASRQRA